RDGQPPVVEASTGRSDPSREQVAQAARPGGAESAGGSAGARFMNAAVRRSLGFVVPVAGLDERPSIGQKSVNALAIIRDEHRSLGAVLHGMLYLIREIRYAGAAPNFEVFHAMLYYIDAFPERF